MASFIVGTFNTPELFQLYFDSVKHDLSLVQTISAHGNHSWLALSNEGRNLYGTAWTEPCSVAAYSIERQSDAIRDPLNVKLLNTAPTRARSGYVAVGKNGNNVVYSVGGPTGEVLQTNKKDGSFTTESHTLQHLDFVSGHVSGSQEEQYKSAKDLEKGGKVLDFGGLRHGSHSIDLSPDGSIAYVADIGRNCVWVYTIDSTNGLLKLSQKCGTPRSNDGPRHVWPHPNGKVVYVLQEHSCIVDVFEVLRNSSPIHVEANEKTVAHEKEVELIWKQNVRIIPAGLAPELFWADEVRTSPGQKPTHLLASTRGLEPETKGYVALFALDDEGYFKGLSRDLKVKQEGEVEWLDIWQSPTSGGWANAVEPCYKYLKGPDGQEYTYAALTDSEQGLVMVLQIKDDKIIEVARLSLGEHQGKVRGAATAVWL
jgi:carboxy-cis,cis-muconate cyclase